MAVDTTGYKFDFITGGGEMGELIRKKDWSKTPIGPVESWPQNLRTTLGIILNSKFPMFVWWGPDLICLYNDAYRPSLGNDGKHPHILGMPAKDAWEEIWDIIYPLIKQVIDTGESTWSEDQLIPIFRNGKIEDVYWTFSYSRINDEDGSAAGVLVTCTETTDKVLNQKRLQEQRDELEFAIEAAELGTWDMNLELKKFSCNKRLRTWLGLGDEPLHDNDAAYNAIALHDRQRIKNAAIHSFQYESGGEFDEEITLRHPVTNEEIIIRAKGKVKFDDSNLPVRFTGTVSNVTKEVFDKRRIIESENNLRTILLNAPVSIAIMHGPDHVVDMVNEKALLMWGREEDQVLGKSLFDSMPELLSQGFRTLMDDVYRTGKSFSGTEWLVQLKIDDELQDVYSNFSFEPLHDPDNNINGILALGVEVTEQVIARKKIEKSELQIRTMVEDAPFPMGLYEGKEMRIVLANQTIKDVWGKGNDVVGKLYTEILPELQNQKIFEELQEVYRTGKTFSKSNQQLEIIIHGKKQRFFFNYTFTPLHDPNGKVYGVMNTAADVTDLNIAKNKIEESERRFRNTVRKAPVGIAILMGRDFVVETANENYLELVSRQENEFVGKPLFEVLPEVKEAVEPLLLNVLETGEPYFGREFPVPINRYGIDEVAYFNFIYQALREEDENISGIIVVANDVTESVLAKHSLGESEKQFRNLVMQSPIPMTIFRGQELVIEMANTVMYDKIWRKKKEEIQGQKLLEVFPELLDQKYPELLRYVMDSGKMYAEVESVAYIQGDDGLKKFYLDYEYAPLFDTDQQVSGIIVTVNDVTEKVEARLKLQEAENRLLMATDATELATWELDLKTNEIIYTSRLTKIFGLPDSAKIPYQAFRDKVFAEDIKNFVEPAFATAVETGVYDYEARLMRPDTTVHWIKTQGKLFFDENNSPSKMVGTIRDITSEKNRQQELLESEKKFRLLADSMPQFVWTADPDGRVTYFNQSLYNFTGMTDEDLTMDGWVKMIHPNDLEKNVKVWMESVKTGKDYLFENRFRRADGEYRWQLSRAIAQIDEDGKIQMWVGTSTDIQDHKTFSNELEKQVSERTNELEVKNRELEKMNAELQSFAYVASHDLQEPLRKIQTFANRILEREANSLSDAGSDYFRRMQKAAKRMQTLIEDLLAYSRTSTTERRFEETSLNDIVEQVTTELKEDILQKQAHIEVGDLSRFSVIPFQFRQLVNNLISNSLKFSKPDVQPVIRIEQKIISGKESGIKKLDDKKKYFVFSVSDNGIGFEQQYQERIFEVFQRLHGRDEYKGTGIGLAIVKKIVDNHNGTIVATSKLNEGARFDIYLPFS